LRSNGRAAEKLSDPIADAAPDGAGHDEPTACDCPRACRLEAGPNYWLFFFSCLAALFSFMVLAGFFFSVFFESMPLLMSCSAMWKMDGSGIADPGTGGNIERGAIGV
jgi:hypothetical protein